MGKHGGPDDWLQSGLRRARGHRGDEPAVLRAASETGYGASSRSRTSLAGKTFRQGQRRRVDAAGTDPGGVCVDRSRRAVLPRRAPGRRCEEGTEPAQARQDEAPSDPMTQCQVRLDICRAASDRVDRLRRRRVARRRRPRSHDEGLVRRPDWCLGRAGGGRPRPTGGCGRGCGAWPVGRRRVASHRCGRFGGRYPGVGLWRGGGRRGEVGARVAGRRGPPFRQWGGPGLGPRWRLPPVWPRPRHVALTRPARGPAAGTG